MQSGAGTLIRGYCNASLKAEYTGVARVRKQRTPFANETRGNVDDRE